MGRDKGGSREASASYVASKIELTRPSLRLLVKVRSAQYRHLVQSAGIAWSSDTEYLQPWHLFGEPLTEREACELVVQAPEMLDSLRPRLSKEVQQGVLDFVKRNWAKMKGYLGTSGISENANEDPNDASLNSTALVDLLSLRDVAEIAVNISTAVRVAFTMHSTHTEMLWQVRSSHRIGAHPLYLSTRLEKHVNSYSSDYADASVSVRAFLYTLMSDSDDGHGSSLAGLEGIPWHADDKTQEQYQYLTELRQGSPQRQARAVWLASASYGEEATPAQLSGDKDAVEHFVESLLLGPPNTPADRPRGLLTRANAKTSLED